MLNNHDKQVNVFDQLQFNDISPWMFSAWIIAILASYFAHSSRRWVFLLLLCNNRDDNLVLNWIE